MTKEDVKVKEIKKYTAKLGASVEFLMEQLNPGARRIGMHGNFQKLLKNPNAILLGAFRKACSPALPDNLVGMVTLYKMETIGRKCVLFEECIVDERFRGLGVGQELTKAAIQYVKDRPELGDRLEGTLNEKNMAAWNCYMKGGFHDRHNRAFFWVRVWE
jgi:GNAT superfamily N-acetyltransferase